MVTKSGLSSYIFLASLQLIVVAIFLLAGSTDASMRDWPIPAIPAGVEKGEMPESWEDFISPWTNYLIYLALIIFLPIIYFLIIFICAFCGCITRCIFCCIPTPLNKKNLSMTKIRFFSLVPFAIGYAILFACTAFSIAFFAWFYIGWMDVRNVTFTVVSDSLDLPSKVVNSTQEIVDFVPDVMTNFVSLINNVTNIESTIQVINTTLNETKTAIVGITPYLDNNKAKFLAIKTRQEGMVARTVGSDFPMPSMNFSGFDNIFQDSASAIDSGVSSTLDTFQDNIGSSLSQVTDAMTLVTDNIGNMNSTLTSTLNDLTTKVKDILDQLEGYYKKYLNKDNVESAHLYTKIGEIVIAVIVVLILSFVLILMTCGFLWIFVRCWCCISALNCCSCCFILIYGILGTLCLFIFFLTGDICTQTEDYIVRSESYYNIQPLSLSTPTGKTVTIKYSSSLLGVIKCENNNFLNASGVSLESFDIPGFIRQYESTYTDSLNSFNLNDFINQSLSGLTDFTQGLNIADDLGVQVETLKDQVNNTIKAFFSAFPLELELNDFENHDTLLNELNTILGSSYTGDQIGPKLAPYAYATSTPTPGKIVAQGPGDDIASYGHISASDRNKVWGSLAVDEDFIPIAPGTVEVGLAFLLSRMNAPSPIYAMETYNDYVALLGEFDDLVVSVSETEVYAKSIFDLSPAVNTVVTSVNSTFNGAVSSVTTFVYDTIDSLIGKVNSLQILECDNIGKVYRTYEQSFCSNLYIAVGGTAATNLAMVLILFLIFILLMNADCLSCRKKKRNSELDSNSFEDDKDRDSDDEMPPPVYIPIMQT